MRKLTLCGLVAAMTILPAAGARADHVPPAVNPTAVTVANAQPVVKHGDIRFVTNVQAGHGVAGVLGETMPFERDGRDYLVASAAYGLSVVDVTDRLRPNVISTYWAASLCPTAPITATLTMAWDWILGIAGWENDLSVSADGRIAALGMDATGRCHDSVAGGVEFIDLSDLRNPRALHLVRNVGDAHSVTIDPERDGLAWTSTSDGNDFVDIIDFRSCLGGVAAIADCEPVVSRAVFAEKHMPGIGPLDARNRDRVNTGCHDLWFQGDRGYCAAVGTTLILDVSDVLAPDGTLTGSHMDCPIVAGELTQAKVTDCYGWTEAAFDEEGYRGANVKLVSVITHDASKPATQDIDVAHQAMATADGKIMYITDERGGGLGFGPGDGECPGGGIWFYDIRDERNPVLMKQPDGSPGVFRTDHYAQTYASCTSHYGEQFGEEHLFAFAWYTGGTHVFRYTPDFSTSPATIEFDEVAAYVPVGAWSIAAKPMVRNPDDPDEVIVYVGDANRGLDVFAVKVAPSGPGARAASLKGGGSGKGSASADAPSGAAGDADTEVLGETARRGTGPRASTGVADTAALALSLIAVAIAIAQRLRKVTI